MNCPVCNVTLLLSEKQGVSIDYCPQCRGIWLEKGNLERIIDKMNSSGLQNHGGYISDSYHSDRHDDHHYKNNYKQKKGLFDFFD